MDKLEGLKENVIIGKLIPAGTGIKAYQNVDFDLESEFTDSEPMEVLENEISDKKKKKENKEDTKEENNEE